MSSAGITPANVGDGIPDILVSQSAQPSSNTDQLEFVDSFGNTVGNIVSLDITLEPVVGNWIVDFYEFNSTQPQSNFINTPRPLHFFTVDFADFGITTGVGGNVGDAVALLYRPNGNSDPSFIAFNEPSLGVATQLTVLSTTVPSNQNCDGTLPSNIQVRLEDKNGNAVAQDGINITASLESGPGSLAGTLTQTTDGSGVATFTDLEFTIGGSHIIRFNFAGLDAGFTAVIEDATGCDSFIWDGSESTDWDNPDNWALGTGNTVFPNANNAVTIPDVSAASNRYPILNIDAGAGDLTMAADASIDLNGFLLALNGSLTITTGAKIDASTAGSELYMSASNAQSIPADLVEPNVANFTVENAGGVILNSEMNITEILNVIQGDLTSNDHITMVCTFTPERKTAQIDQLIGTISGDVTVEQCYPGRRAFRMVSASTTTTTSIHDNWQEGATAYNNNPNDGFGTHITGLGEVAGSGHTSGNSSPSDQVNGLDWQPSGNASMFSFNASTQGWDMVLDTEGTTLNAGDAYLMMIRGSRAVDLTSNASDTFNTILRSSGKVARGDVTINPGIGNSEFAFIGNPYHAAVNMNKVLAPNSGYKDFIYFFDPNLGGAAETNPDSNTLGGRGGYVTVDIHNNNTTIQSSVAGVTTTESNLFLQPYQAVFVEASSSVTPGSITFKESYKDIDQLQIDVFSTGPNPHIFVNLFDEDSFNNLSSPDDGTVIYFSSTSSNAVDNNDAVKFFNQDETLARIQDGNLISYENRALPEDDEVLELYITQYRTKNYKLEIGVFDFPNQDVYLYDNYLETEVALNNDDNYIYSFSVDASNPESNATDRFEIVIQQTTFSTNESELQGISIHPNPVKDMVTVDLSQFTGEAKQLQVFDITGKLINQKDISNGDHQFNINMTGIASGVYILKIETATGQFQHKLIKE